MISVTMGSWKTLRKLNHCDYNIKVDKMKKHLGKGCILKELCGGRVEINHYMIRNCHAFLSYGYCFKASTLAVHIIAYFGIKINFKVNNVRNNLTRAHYVIYYVIFYKCYYLFANVVTEICPLLSNLRAYSKSAFALLAVCQT